MVIEKIEETFSSENKLDLSPKEEVVIRLISKGASNKEIAETLVIAESTVKSHLRSILVKLNAKNRTQAAVIYSTRNGGK